MKKEEILTQQFNDEDEFVINAKELQRLLKDKEILLADNKSLRRERNQLQICLDTALAKVKVYEDIKQVNNIRKVFKYVVWNRWNDGDYG